MRQKESIFTNFNQYLIVLALVDSFLIIMFVIDDVLVGLIKSGEWFFTVVPYITHPVKCISITMSMVWVLIIAMKRFQAVTQPFNRYKRYDSENFFSYAIFMMTFSVTVNLSK